MTRQSAVQSSGSSSPSRSLTPRQRLAPAAHSPARSTAQHHHNTPGLIQLPPSHHINYDNQIVSAAASRHSAFASPSASPRKSRTARRPKKATEQYDGTSATSTVMLPTNMPRVGAEESAGSGHPPVSSQSQPHAVNQEPISSKNRRSRPKAHRQTSPPAPDSEQPLAPAEPPASPPPARSHAKTHTHTHTHLRPNRNKGYYESSSADEEWDMPTVNATNVKPVAALTWQQESLGLGRSNSVGHGREQRAPRAKKVSNETVSTPRAGLAKAPAHSARPPLNGSISDSGPTTSSSSSGLTWQQELLQGSGGERTSSSSPLKQQQAGTPGRGISRKQQQRDDETFGLGGLDLSGGDSSASAPEDLFGPLEPDSKSQKTPRRTGNRNINAQPASTARRQTQPQFHSQTQAKNITPTPTKPVEERYAGPTFHNSPLPSSLPTPSFLLRRKQQMATEVN